MEIFIPSIKNKTYNLTNSLTYFKHILAIYTLKIFSCSYLVCVVEVHVYQILNKSIRALMYLFRTQGANPMWKTPIRRPTIIIENFLYIISVSMKPKHEGHQTFGSFDIIIYPIILCHVRLPLLLGINPHLSGDPTENLLPD